MELTGTGVGVIVILLFYSTQFEVEGCKMRPIPYKYRQSMPDAIYHYVAREEHKLDTVKGKALPGEVCNYDHRTLSTNKKKNKPVDYSKFHAECVEESDPETSSTCEYVYDRNGYPIALSEIEIQVDGHPEDRWNKLAKPGDTSIMTKIYYKKCICPYKTPSGELVYHKTWDTKVDPPRPSCTKEDHSHLPKDPGARGYTCHRVDKKKEREKDKVVQHAIRNNL